ncbi:MAG: hypothetical protein GXP63_03060 [DPANN group archaeon]|nr:hypothetical protein [DPANN group archaeon]
MEKKTRSGLKKNGRGYFLLASITLYLLTFFFSPDRMMPILESYLKLILQILPIFIIVYAFMVLIDYLVTEDLLKHMMGKEAGIRGWFIAIVTGIISVGPVYVWYPLLRNLQKRGIRVRFLSTFLYNRGIKLQWASLLILYFGWTYTLVLLTVMAVFSIPQGLITERFTMLSKKKGAS